MITLSAVDAVEVPIVPRDPAAPVPLAEQITRLAARPMTLPQANVLEVLRKAGADGNLTAEDIARELKFKYEDVADALGQLFELGLVLRPARFTWAARIDTPSTQSLKPYTPPPIDGQEITHAGTQTDTEGTRGPGPGPGGRPEHPAEAPERAPGTGQRVVQPGECDLPSPQQPPDRGGRQGAMPGELERDARGDRGGKQVHNPEARDSATAERGCNQAARAASGDRREPNSLTTVDQVRAKLRELLPAVGSRLVLSKVVTFAYLRTRVVKAGAAWPEFRFAVENISATGGRSTVVTRAAVGETLAGIPETTPPIPETPAGIPETAAPIRGTQARTTHDAEAITAALIQRAREECDRRIDEAHKGFRETERMALAQFEGRVEGIRWVIEKIGGAA